MALTLYSPWNSRLCHPSPTLFRTSSVILAHRHKAFLILFLSKFTPSSRLSPHGNRLQARASVREGSDGESSGTGFLDEQLLRAVSSASDADQVLEIIAEKTSRSGGTVGTSDCCRIIKAALERSNADLAFSIVSAMRSTFDSDGSEEKISGNRWKWARPDVHTYASLVMGLAALLRVSDAIHAVSYISRMGDSDEVPFGTVVRCPTCMIAIAVAQPQHGIQVASCSKCRYQYELVSGDIYSIESEEISMDISAWERGLEFFQLKKQGIPAAVHSVVVQSPTGAARTYRIATKTVELPAQEGERVTIVLAASNAYLKMGPLQFTAAAPRFNPGEPMSLTNHITGQESLLVRAPAKNGSSFLLNPSFLFPAAALLASGDVATGVIDPSLPKIIPIVAVASLVFGAAVNSVVLPQLKKLPQRMVDVIAIKQQLLSQYDLLQKRIKTLRQAAEKEIWMLARMCQLENKIVSVGEPSYRNRRSRVKKVRESLENSLVARLELIDSYSKISSMIEIEVEMDSDVLAAEAVSNAETIAEQIEQIMELEALEERWRIQAEANDEVERLLSSPPMSTEVV